MNKTTRAVLATLASTAALAGCATDGQGQLVFDPTKVNAVITATLAPQPVVVEEVYQPMPTDVYVSGVVDSDIVILHGDTYMWVRGADGVRRREFYAHGDHRADVMHRRDELHAVMARHGGRLPDHPIGHPGVARPNRMAPVAHAQAPSRAAPPAKSNSKEKKS
ncbi:MAG TPA: hypothetical protein VGG24_03815 [Paraburkholderia sp.]|jgi:hypothetical protein